MAAFDTLTTAKELQSAGFNFEQAEAIARTVQAGQGGEVTTADIDKLRIELTAIKWVLGMVAVLSLSTLATVLAIYTASFS